MHLGDIKKAIIESWDKDTCYPEYADEWTQENPSYGQCAVTALIIQDYFGGDLLYCKHNNHYWNRLPDNKDVDLTLEQFPRGTVICFDEVKSRDTVLNCESALKASTLKRYKLVKKRVEDKLKKRQ